MHTENQHDEFEQFLRQFQLRTASPIEFAPSKSTNRVSLWLAAAGVAVVVALGVWLQVGHSPTQQNGAVPPVPGGDVLKPSRGAESISRALTQEIFDVASVKVTPPESAGPAQPSITLLPRGGSFRKTNTTLKMLVQLAYGVQEYQVSGGPNWIDAIRYDIEAKAAVDANRDQVLNMIQGLLADRFQLRVKHETKEAPVYHLVAEKTAAAKLSPSQDSSSADVRIGRYSGKRTMTQLAQYLGSIVERPVIDKSGLSGNYDIQLSFTPETFPIGPRGPVVDPNGPSIFTALREQLGLKLESARGPVEYVIIEDAQKPAAN
jgi:uncharacterized protein (TIGR03435 family)